MDRDLSLRTTFNSRAELYQAIRPHYPEALFDVLVDTAELQTGAKLLEIGPGTGQATLPLAKRGFEITAVELGADMAAVARRELAQFQKVNIITGAFEDLSLPENNFDLVYSATAFHWIKPEVKFTKPHKLLKSGGCLAIIGTNHVSDEKGDNFYQASIPIYRKYRADKNWNENFKLPLAADSQPDPVDESLFTPVSFHVFPLVIRYSAKEYANLLNTYSHTLALEPSVRENFLSEIEQLLVEHFGGFLDKHFAMTLMVAKKKEVF